jgi:hypothetical protein
LNSFHSCVLQNKYLTLRYWGDKTQSWNLFNPLDAFPPSCSLRGCSALHPEAVQELEGLMFFREPFPGYLIWAVILPCHSHNYGINQDLKPMYICLNLCLFNSFELGRGGVSERRDFALFIAVASAHGTEGGRGSINEIDLQMKKSNCWEEASVLQGKNCAGAITLGGFQYVVDKEVGPEGVKVAQILCWGRTAACCFDGRRELS